MEKPPPVNSFYSQTTLPFAKPPNVSSPSVTQRIVVSHTLLFLYSATTTLYFFFLSFLYQLPASGRRQTFQPGREAWDDEFFFMGVVVSLYKNVRACFTSYIQTNLERGMVLNLMDEKKNAQTPPTIAYYPHIIILAIQLQQRNLEPLRLDSTRPVPVP